MVVSREIISAVIYTEVDDKVGPNPIYRFPSDLKDDFVMNVSIKTITFLSAEKGMIPKSIVIFPFPSLEQKAVTKYLEWKDETRRGKVGNSAITFLFKEADDAILYKYYRELAEIFDRHGKKVELIEKNKGAKDAIIKEIDELSKSIEWVLEEMKHQEETAFKPSTYQDKPTWTPEVYQYKLVVCGDPMVGKTSLIVRYTQKAFTRSYLPTLGVSVSSKLLPLEDIIAQLVIWDIAGQQKFSQMRTAFYKGAKGVILIFDLTDRSSFDNIPSWHEDIRTNLYKNYIYKGLLIGNKLDKSRDRAVSFEEAKQLADKLGFEYIETSALTSENVDDAFYHMTFILHETNI